MCAPLCCTRDGHEGTCACTPPVCTVLHNGHAHTSCVHHHLRLSQNLLGILQTLTVIYNQFPGQQQQSNMPDSTTCCKRTPTCCCAISALVILVISAFSIPLATQMMGSDPVIPPGASGPIDIHKSLIDRMSLLSISQEGSEGEGMATSTWILLIVFGATIIFLCTGYAYHVKCRLPKRRIARETERAQRERNERNTAFIERLMENQGISPV